MVPQKAASFVGLPRNKLLSLGRLPENRGNIEARWLIGGFFYLKKMIWICFSFSTQKAILASLQQYQPVF